MAPSSATAIFGRPATAVMFHAQRKWPIAEFLASIRASRYESFVFLCLHLRTEKCNPSRNAAVGWSCREKVKCRERDGESGGRGGRKPGDDCPRAENLE